MSFAETLADAQRQMRDRGASAAEIATAQKLLAWLASHNRGTTHVRLARGVVVAVAGSDSNRGLRTEARVLGT